MKKTLSVLALCIPVLLVAQVDSTFKGIKFEQGLSWEKIKQEAALKHKAIFLDLFTTWCAFCKVMDKEVYPSDSAGSFYNDHFVSARVQMDTMPSDDEFTKSWYLQASLIEKRYRIKSYPTFLFFTADGKIVYKDAGYKNVTDFIMLGQQAKLSEQSYANVYEDYLKSIEDYRSGLKDYDKMLFLINTAKKLNDFELADSLSNDFSAHLRGLSTSQLNQRPILEFIAGVIKSSKDPLFPLFYSKPEKVDALMKQSGYARSIVDKVIRLEETGPALKAALNTQSEPNWDSLFSELTFKFTRKYADRAVLAAKVRWYEYHSNWPLYTNNFIKLVELYGIESLLIYRSIVIQPSEKPSIAIDGTLNYFSMEMIFRRSTDRKEIAFAIKYMKDVVKRSAFVNSYWAHATRDTYANLLYKYGDKKNAIKMEKEAIKYAIKGDEQQSVAEYTKVIEKINKNLPTW